MLGWFAPDKFTGFVAPVRFQPDPVLTGSRHQELIAFVCSDTIQQIAGNRHREAVARPSDHS